jgi:V8-like Glu-specific endopeptidase
MNKQENDNDQKRREDSDVWEPPITEEEVARKFVAESEAEVPDELQDIEQPELEPYVLMGTTREEVAKTKVRIIEPARPGWVASTAIPKKAPVPFKPRKIEHRGQLLEPGLVFAPDDRRTYNDRSYPWGIVCKIVTAAGWGSGVIVGPRHVLTASHVVDWTRNGAGSVEVLRVGGSVRTTTAISAVWYYTKVTGLVEWSENDEDYAVLVTATRIGDMFGWLGTRTYNSSWDGDRYWFSFGYPGDIGSGNSPVWQRRKWLDEDAWDWGGGRSMTTDADMIPGQSGSPMFAWWSDGPYVVAVWSNYSSTENWCSGGNDMTRLVGHARSQDP